MAVWLFSGALSDSRHCSVAVRNYHCFSFCERVSKRGRLAEFSGALSDSRYCSVAVCNYHCFSFLYAPLCVAVCLCLSFRACLTVVLSVCLFPSVFCVRTRQGGRYMFTYGQVKRSRRRKRRLKRRWKRGRREVIFV